MKRSTVLTATLVLFGALGALGRGVERASSRTCLDCGEHVAGSIGRPLVCRRCVVAS